MDKDLLISGRDSVVPRSVGIFLTRQLLLQLAKGAAAAAATVVHCPDTSLGYKF